MAGSLWGEAGAGGREPAGVGGRLEEPFKLDLVCVPQRSPSTGTEAPFPRGFVQDTGEFASLAQALTMNSPPPLPPHSLQPPPQKKKTTQKENQATKSLAGLPWGAPRLYSPAGIQAPSLIPASMP